ncbi:response regulator with CheY-like receiver, AAA-type ATPase, and DNA-binding domains, partial [Leptothrix ochracea L12]
NLLERASLLCDGPVLEPHHVEEALTPEFSRMARVEAIAPAPALTRTAADPTTVGGESPLSWQALGRDLLRTEVQAHRGSRAELAKRLGVSERTLYRRLKTLEGKPD